MRIIPTLYPSWRGEQIARHAHFWDDLVGSDQSTTGHWVRDSTYGFLKLRAAILPKLDKVRTLSQGHCL
jgi:hypothetical protein